MYNIDHSIVVFLSTQIIPSQELHGHSQGSPTYTEFQGYIANLHQFTGVMPAIPVLNKEVVRLEGPPSAGGENICYLMFFIPIL